ncbi:MAG: threonine/serine dehydratase [Chloroflexaceae bacterium]|nr:threonine/serine dehydratase [Chloroflexaceae bacterium]
MTYNLALYTIQQAYQRIKPYVRHTPMMPAPLMHTDVSSNLLLKLENMQLTGSFKLRGVINTLLSLTDEERQRGVVASSGGNHGLALAYAAQRLGIPATIYLPNTATADRVNRIRYFQAQVVQYGTVWDEAHTRALEHAAQDNLYYVHPFNAPRTLAGQGTLGLELLDDVPDVDCVLIAIGGGGLIGGMGAALKQLRPQLRIIGVEPTGAASMDASLKAGYVVELPSISTIADTLQPRSVGEMTFSLAQRYVDAVVLVEDHQMIEAMRWLWLECNQLVEPAGAAVIAALLNGNADIRTARRPVAVICGGNAAAGSVFTTYEAAL